MEVVYTGLHQTPERIAEAALQEDVQVVGLSVLSGAHNALVPRVRQALLDRGLDDVVILVGGIIPDADVASLHAEGVAGVFPPASSISEIVEFITKSVKPRN
jgi:methylmalonyl-CoA mutase C-terminal domain/subunit